jgi:ABC-2 type transport system permease protein
MTGVVALLLLRGVLRGKRMLGLGAVTAAPVLLAAVGASVSLHDPTSFVAGILESLFLPTVAAFVALILAAGVLGDERDDGTILYLAATPLPRRTLVVGAFLAAWVAALAVLVPAAVLVILAAGTVTFGGLLHVIVGTALTVAAYSAVFLFLSLATRRPVLFGVLYILIWESVIAGFAPSAQRLSIASYGKTIVADALPDADRANVPAWDPTASLVVLVVVVAAGIAASVWALRRVELP